MRFMIKQAFEHSFRTISKLHALATLQVLTMIASAFNLAGQPREGDGATSIRPHPNPIPDSVHVACLDLGLLSVNFQN